MSLFKHSPRVFTIPAHSHFMDDFVLGLTKTFGETPEGLSKIDIYLPNRRSRSTLQNSFLRHFDGKPMLLPNIVPIGDALSDDELHFDTGLKTLLDLPPPIDPMKRLGLLSKILFEKRDALGFKNLTHAGAIQLASALGQLLDQMQTEGVSEEDFQNLVPEEFAEHWQNILKFI